MKNLLKMENLNGSYASDKKGFDDLEFLFDDGRIIILRNAKVYENTEEYWDKEENLNRTIDEAEESDIYYIDEI